MLLLFIPESMAGCGYSSGYVAMAMVVVTLIMIVILLYSTHHILLHFHSLTNPSTTKHVVNAHSTGFMTFGEACGPTKSSTILTFEAFSPQDMHTLPKVCLHYHSN